MVVTPDDPNGTIAKLSLTVNDETGMVDSLTIENSGSGYNYNFLDSNPTGESEYKLYFANGGDRTTDNVPEQRICEELGVEMIWGIGGGKIQSSSWLIDGKK